MALSPFRDRVPGLIGIAIIVLLGLTYGSLGLFSLVPAPWPIAWRRTPDLTWAVVGCLCYVAAIVRWLVGPMGTDPRQCRSPLFSEFLSPRWVCRLAGGLGVSPLSGLKPMHATLLFAGLGTASTLLSIVAESSAVSASHSPGLQRAMGNAIPG